MVMVMVILPIAVTPMLTTMQAVMQPMVPMLDAVSPDTTMRLGASLCDRATLPSPLRGLDPSGGYPSRLRSLRSLRAPLARRLADALRRVLDRRRRAAFDYLVGTTAASSSRRRFAQRSSQTSPRSPWPAAPATGIASSSARGTPCVAGAGFAAHRLAHSPPQCSLHSFARSCGARPHFAPHRVVHRCPHQCGHRRLRLRQRAAHDCLRLPPHRPPLNRRGGSPSPASPASIPRTWMQQDWPFRTARGGLGSHTRRTWGAWRARMPTPRLQCPRA